MGGKQYGNNHPRKGHFQFYGLAVGLDLTALGDIGSTIKSFMTKDGKVHSDADIEATDVPFEMYQTDQAQVQAVMANHEASKTATPGYKYPGTMVSFGEGGEVAAAWNIQECWFKEVKHTASDRDGGDAAMLTGIISMYNPVKTK